MKQLPVQSTISRIPATLILFLFLVLTPSFASSAAGENATAPDSWPQAAADPPDKAIAGDGNLLELTETERQWITAHPTIRVGRSPHQPPFTIDRADRPTGYLYDLLMDVLAIAGLQAEFSESFTAYNDMISALEEGRLDIVTDVDLTRRLGSNVIKTLPVVRTPYAIVARVVAPEAAGVSDLFNMKIVAVEGTALDKRLEKFPQIEHAHIKNHRQGFEAVRQEQADYFINNLANAEYVLNKNFATDLKVAGTLSYEDFPPLTLSFAIHGADTPLPGIINKALAAVPIHTLSLLQSKWLPLEFTVKKPDRISLTPEEKAFIKDHPVIRVHNEQNWAPFNFNENGLATGFSIDYMNLLAQKIGLQVKYISGPGWGEFISMIVSRELDVMLNIVKTGDLEEFIRFTTEPYLETPRAIVVRKEAGNIRNLNDLHGKTMVVEKGFFYEDYLKQAHPEINVTTAWDTTATLRMVANGSADATLGVIAVEQFLISKHFFSNLKLVVDPGEKALRSFDQYMGVRSDWPILAGLLDKAMAAVTADERFEISNRWIQQELAQVKTTVELSPGEQEFLRTHPVIRVANETDYPPFDFSENGEPKGYSIDYLNLLAEKIPIRLEYVNGYAWNDLLDMFERREIDMIHSAMESEQRLKYALFTRPYLHQLHAMVTRRDAPGLKTLEDLKGKTLAMQKGYATNEFILPRYPGITPLWVSNTLEGLKAVASGQADAVIDAQTVVSYLIKKHLLTNLEIANSLQFWHGDEQDLRVGVRADWPVLQTIIEKAMDMVTQDEEAAIQGKWFGMDEAATKTDGISLTREEREYLLHNRTFTVAFDKDWPPVEFADKDSPMNGMAADYLKIIGDMLDVDFVPSRPLSWQHTIRAVQKGELDFFSAITPTPRRGAWMTFTDPYLSFPIVIFTKKEVPYVGGIDDLADKTVAVVEGYATHDFLLQDYPDLTLLPLRNVQEALMVVSAGKAYAFIGNLATANHIINREGLTNLKVSGETPYVYNLAMGSGKENKTLVGILNKALAAIPSRDKSAINSRWTSVTFEQKTDYTLFWGLLAVGVGMLAFVLYWNRRLQIEVAERKRAEKTAAQASKAKSEFLANMSHELRTPLNAILGFTQIMERNPDVSAEKESLAIIQRSGNHLLTLINQVLDLSKIEAGRIHIDKNCFDLFRLLDELEHMFSLKTREKHITLLFENGEDVPRYVCTDEIKLRQVLINLLGNAVKFTDAGSVTLRTSVIGGGKRQSPDSRDCLLQFEIIDTGKGIAKDEIKHLFKAFGQTSSGREVREGTGLGLVISSKFVELLGGRMRLDSEVGKGSTFIFDVPAEIMTGNDTAADPPLNKALGLEPGQPIYRMLIVDDNGDNRTLLARILKPFGFELREAGSGREALDICEAWRPDLIWMDMRMPDMDGYETAKHIRERTAPDALRPVIVAVTASVFHEKQKDARQYGCDDLVIKPFKENDIIEMLAKHLKVRFLYAKTKIMPPSARQQPEHPLPKPSDFHDLPAETVAQLKTSVNTLDMDAAFAAIEKIRRQNKPLADALHKLVKEYRFDTLQELLND